MSPRRPKRFFKGEKLSQHGVMEMNVEKLSQRLARMEQALELIIEHLEAKRREKEWYTTSEAAQMLEKRPYTVREWCRLGRIHADKAMSGRGIDEEWRISHEEIERIRNSGLLPLKQHF